jgi:bifunctional ADP-heptose synthase (sugar kinase/adenylyltransferase)
VNPENLVITLGERGLVIFNKKNEIINIPTFAKEVFDVSGAGDTVISVLTLCLACGLDIKTSAIIANHAAGAVCAKRGIHPATVEDIILSVKYYEMVSGK